MKPSIVIMAGGTGGHVFPALAVAKEWQQRGYHIHWLGGEQGIEHRLVPAAGYPLKTLTVKGLRSGGVLRKLLAPWMIVSAVREARAWLKQVQPALVMGFGGYASGPGGLAARWCGIPLVVHEQNAIPGLTNRVLSRFATLTLAAFDGAFPASVAVVGNPVREEILALPSSLERYAERQGALQILILGGSQGALALNTILPSVLAQVIGDKAVIIRHQAGRGRRDETLKAYEGLGLKVQVDEFIDDMAEAYGWADLVISRAGALTITELAAAGVAALCIPLPTAADDHQTHNAQWLAGFKAARVLPQAQLNVAGLQQQLMDILERKTLAQMAELGRQALTQNSAKRVVDVSEELLHG